MIYYKQAKTCEDKLVSREFAGLLRAPCRGRDSLLRNAIIYCTCGFL